MFLSRETILVLVLHEREIEWGVTPVKDIIARLSFGAVLGTISCTVLDPTPPSPPEGAASPTKESTLVGPAGAHLTLAGAELDVPPNAVGTNITITVSSDAPKPESHLVDGLVYHFEPAGLVFSRPIKVSFPTAGPGQLVFWTIAGSTDAFEPLVTAIENGKTVAHPKHFSLGFVGKEKDKPAKKCEGARDEACGNCGTRTRSCNDGVWSDWGACEREGVCTPTATEACEYGMRTCGARCQWDACEPKKACEGPTSEACGNCGIRTRACDDRNGKWLDWSACAGEGVCTPNATQACGTGGTQTCTGGCQWGGCTNQTCGEPISRPCGDCGTQSRLCDNGFLYPWGSCVECACVNPSTCPARTHATSTCTGAQCGFTCDPGWADLDQDASNGCEFELSSSLECITKRRVVESCIHDQCTCSQTVTNSPTLALEYGGAPFGALGSISSSSTELDSNTMWEATDATRTRYNGFDKSSSYILRSPGPLVDQHVLDMFLDHARGGTSVPRGCEDVPLVEVALPRPADSLWLASMRRADDRVLWQLRRALTYLQRTDRNVVGMVGVRG